MEKALQVPLLQLQVTRPMHTVLSVLMVGVLFASMTFDTACPVSQTNIQKAEEIASEVLQALPLALQLISTFGTQIPANVLTTTQSFSGQAVTDLQLVSSLLAQYQQQASSTLVSKINAALADAQTNMAAMLQALHVVNPNTVATIQSVMGPIIAAISAIEEAVVAVSGKLGAKKAGQAKVKFASSAKLFKSQFNSAITNAGHPELGLK